MTKIFLATHGRMASGMKSSIDLLMGSSEAVSYPHLDVYKRQTFNG